MNPEPIDVERRGAQRFQVHLPVCICSGDGRQGHAFTQDLSGRGGLLYTDFALAMGDALELTFTMPSEITLTEPMAVRCRAKVVRVMAHDSKLAVAVHLEKYEFLPEKAGDAGLELGRVSALHQHPNDEREVPDPARPSSVLQR